jgi:hypothetical protein
MKPKFKKHSIQLLGGRQTFIHDVTGDGTKKSPFRYWVDVPFKVTGGDYEYKVLRRKGVLVSRLRPLPPRIAKEVSRIQWHQRRAKLTARCIYHGDFLYPMYDIEGFHQFHTRPECPTCVKERA